MSVNISVYHFKIESKFLMSIKISAKEYFICYQILMMFSDQQCTDLQNQKVSKLIQQNLFMCYQMQSFTACVFNVTVRL